MDNADSPLTRPHAEGTEAHQPQTWKFRVVYAGSVGIVKPVPVCWSGARPLGIGRRSESPVAGPWLRVEDEPVSREHARIYRTRLGVVVEDLHSRNGSFLNGVRLRAGAARRLDDGDVLRVGNSFIVARFEPAKPPDVSVPALVGVSLVMCALRRAIDGAARHERPVLLVGEPGSGRGLAAQTIHQLSQRRRNLVAVSCESMQAEQLEEQFFGVQRGGRPARGFLTDAHQGSLFLNEVAALPLEMQGKLVAALKSGQALPVGGSEAAACDVRVLAATRRELTAAVRDQSISAELLAAGDIIPVAPLRARREDILLLVQYFAGPTFWVSPRMVAALLAYGWPLNVREVPLVIDRLRNGSEQDAIRSLSSSSRTVPAEPELMSGTESEPSELTPSRSARPPAPSREQIIALLEQYSGNLSRIQAEHGYSRRQFHRWVDRYGLDLSSYRR